MGKKKKWAWGLLAAAACFLPAGIALASWAAQQTTDNFLTMASYKVKVEEKYETPQHVNPAERVSKVVNVKNEGTVDILVRVRVEKAFGVRGEDGVLVKDDTLRTDVIEIDFNDTLWRLRDDGWFYYREVLKAGETTREPLMKSYRLSPRTGNAYKGKDAEIVVYMESVQAYGDALSVWNVSKEELGIKWKDTYERKDTGVIFRGKEQGFSVQAQDTDLFAAFKNLVPGCGRTQSVIVTNQSQEKVEIFLHAQEAGQESMTQEQRELVEKLLKKYAVIQVSDRGKVLYEGAVCGKDGENSMQGEISLGEFQPGESRELVVTLSLSPEMDNRFQKLTGKVTWIFSARGEDGEVLYRSAPVTGDTTAAGMWAALLLVSGASLWLAFRAERKNRRKRADEVSEMDS